MNGSMHQPTTTSTTRISTAAVSERRPPRKQYPPAARIRSPPTPQPRPLSPPPPTTTTKKIHPSLSEPKSATPTPPHVEQSHQQQDGDAPSSSWRNTQMTVTEKKLAALDAARRLKIHLTASSSDDGTSSVRHHTQSSSPATPLMMSTEAYADKEQRLRHELHHLHHPWAAVEEELDRVPHPLSVVHLLSEVHSTPTSSTSLYDDTDQGHVADGGSDDVDEQHQPSSVAMLSRRARGVARSMSTRTPTPSTAQLLPQQVDALAVYRTAMSWMNDRTHVESLKHIDDITDHARELAAESQSLQQAAASLWRSHDAHEHFSLKDAAILAGNSKDIREAAARIALNVEAQLRGDHPPSSNGLRQELENEEGKEERMTQQPTSEHSMIMMMSAIASRAAENSTVSPPWTVLRQQREEELARRDDDETEIDNEMEGGGTPMQATRGTSHHQDSAVAASLTSPKATGNVIDGGGSARRHRVPSSQQKEGHQRIRPKTYTERFLLAASSSAAGLPTSPKVGGSSIGAPSRSEMVSRFSANNSTTVSALPLTVPPLAAAFMPPYHSNQYYVTNDVNATTTSFFNNGEEIPISRHHHHREEQQFSGWGIINQKTPSRCAADAHLGGHDAHFYSSLETQGAAPPPPPPLSGLSPSSPSQWVSDYVAIRLKHMS